MTLWKSQSIAARFHVTILATLSAAVVHAASPVQEGNGQRNNGCKDCHECDKPTAVEPCLRSCSRKALERVADQFSHMKVPRFVLLDELANHYLPVPFDHEGHAEMAEMAGGCGVCHHFTPENAAHPACKTCHAPGPNQGDIRKPGLKGAYHRQCLSCHREWSHETACGTCHLPKTGRDTDSPGSQVPSADDIVGRMHPPIPEPETELYETNREGYEPTRVLFRHRAHTHKYGLGCSECHREDNCNRCHEAGKQHQQLVRSLDDHHRPCLNCHENYSCDGCHFKPTEEPPAPFDHARTGWPLSRYHQDVGCRTCHREVPFKKRDRACNACHEDWVPDNFDHTVTGQKLDDNHVQIDCASCHPDRKFDKAPKCDDCHDEDDGIGFPDKRPGTFNNLSD